MAEPLSSAQRLSRLFYELEDFGAPPPKPVAPVVETEEAAEEKEPEPDRVSLLQIEFDAHIAAARQEGIAQGRAETEEALRAQYEAYVATLVDGLRQENQRRYAVVEQAADAFVQTVVESVTQLTKLPPEVLQGVQRNLVADAADFVRECEGRVRVVCSAHDAPLLKGILGEDAESEIDVQEGVAAGNIHIVTAGNSILIDTQQWQHAVLEKLVKTVTALAQQGMSKEESRRVEP